MTDERGINIEHHDHDYHPHGYGHGYGGGGFGVWGLFGFIAFIVIIAWIWGIGRRNEEHHERLSDKHHEGLRCVDKLGYEMGYTRKELNDMQYEIRAGLASQVKWHDDELRFGQPYGEHTQRLCTAPPAHCGEHRGRGFGNVMNGSQFSETNTAAYDRSVMI
jgi:uncharacterized membrane protein